jgi:hypothetical protein
MWEKSIFVCNTITGSRDNAVVIPTDYRLHDEVIGSRVFSSLHCPMGSGAHTVHYLMGSGFPSLSVKWLGHKADQSPPTSAKTKRTWIYISTPHIFMAQCLNS